MSGEEGRGFDEAVQRLTSLINSHYRPKGSDAEATFKKLPLWLEVRKRVVVATCMCSRQLHKTMQRSDSHQYHAEQFV